MTRLCSISEYYLTRDDYAKIILIYRMFQTTVNVYSISTVTARGNCTYGDVRLVGGSTQYEGRVEVCINDQ